MEALEVGQGKEMAAGIMHSFKYFLVPILTNMGLPDQKNVHLDVTSLDKTTLFALDKVSNEVPKELRPGSKHPTKEGFALTYLFFPYDADAMEITVVVSLGNTTLRFPFARSAQHMWFADPDTIKNFAATPIESPKENKKELHPVQPKSALSFGCETTIKTHIDGDFNGWEGETVYEMDDGTIWKQATYHYHYHFAFHPEVLIYKDNYGMCRIIVKGDDDDEEVAVRRLK
jgi:hypothetical protein